MNEENVYLQHSLQQPGLLHRSPRVPYYDIRLWGLLPGSVLLHQIIGLLAQDLLGLGVVDQGGVQVRFI